MDVKAGFWWTKEGRACYDLRLLSNDEAAYNGVITERFRKRWPQFENTYFDYLEEPL